eukprot:Skav224890  [mRNA]  locus=scaffold1112:309418:309642:- [translate_table: standard]
MAMFGTIAYLPGSSSGNRVYNSGGKNAPWCTQSQTSDQLSGHSAAVAHAVSAESKGQASSKGMFRQSGVERQVS